MALFDWISPDHDLRLDGEGVRLRPHRASDYAEWVELRARSRDFLQPWEPTWPSDDLTRAAFRRRLAAYSADIERGGAYPFLVFRKSDGAMVGGITLSNIRRGVAQMGSIGYWVGEPFARQGHTVAAVRAVTKFCFGRIGLHRVEAACLPSNEASQGVLRKAGFQQEGLARAYLRINGAWRDHLLFGLLNTAPLNEQWD
jgi:ribosomal-protein-alanine N-acetyltransferase